uniref:J domain-containing protein n=1 Tax=Gopherus agassizii TaxID=38772 RepID=A0A452GU58_9SAUR
QYTHQILPTNLPVNKEHAERKFKEIAEAYEVLSDSKGPVSPVPLGLVWVPAVGAGVSCSSRLRVGPGSGGTLPAQGEVAMGQSRLSGPLAVLGRGVCSPSCLLGCSQRDECYTHWPSVPLSAHQPPQSLAARYFPACRAWESLVTSSSCESMGHTSGPRPLKGVSHRCVNPPPSAEGQELALWNHSAVDLAVSTLGLRLAGPTQAVGVDQSVRVDGTRCPLPGPGGAAAWNEAQWAALGRPSS